MKLSESITNISKSLSLFQEEVQDPAKNSDNPFFKSKYVELDDLLQATRPVLSKHGLSVLQEPTSQDGQTVSIKTIILHSSGEWIEFDPLALKAVKPDPQGIGSAITYGRRYSLSSILGVAWDADDDGNGASGKPKITQKPEQSASKQPLASNLMSDQQLKKLFAMSKENGLTPDDMKNLLHWKYNVTSSKELTKQQAGEAIEKLQDIWSEYVAEQSKVAQLSE